MRAISLFLLLTVAMVLFFNRIQSNQARANYVPHVPKPLPWPAPPAPAEPQPEEPKAEAPGAVVIPEPVSPADLVVETSSPLVTSVDILGNADNGGIQLNWAGESGTGLEASWLSDEGLSLGLRKSFLLHGSWQGFISGGVFLDDEEETSTTTTTEIIRRGRCHHPRSVTTVSTTNDIDEMLRPYGQVGVNYLLDKSWKVGLMYRHNFVDDDSNVDRDAVMLSFGVSF